MENSQPTKPEIKFGTTQKDGIVEQLKELHLPVTRENYLMLAFAGKPPKEPLDEEIEEMLPRNLRRE